MFSWIYQLREIFHDFSKVMILIENTFDFSYKKIPRQLSFSHPTFSPDEVGEISVKDYLILAEIVEKEIDKIQHGLRLLYEKLLLENIPEIKKSLTKELYYSK